MPIWSLTKERVEKLLAHIRDIELEIDTLIKLTREDLWSRDLDDFINEWRTQLDEEANLRKKIASMGRRGSSKLNINAKVPGRKRKAHGEDPNDSDFGAKAVARKAAPVKRAPTQSTLLSESAPLAKPAVAKKRTASSKVKTLGAKTSSLSEDAKPLQQIKEASLSLESVSTSDLPVAPIFQKAKAAAPTSKKIAPVPKVLSEDEDDGEASEEIIRPVATRNPRQAAKNVPTYNLDDSDSDGDDMLLDVGKMVKGIGNASSDQAAAFTARPLFSASMSRPGSSAGLPRKSSLSLAANKQSMEMDGDDTDYSKLAPPPAAAKRGISVTGRRTIISDDDDMMDGDGDDDDDDDVVLVAGKKPPPSKKAAASTTKASKDIITATKPAAKAKPKANISVSAASKQAKASSQPLPPRKLPAPPPTLSPAAKAYAAKRLRINKAMLPDDDSDDDNHAGINSYDGAVHAADEIEKLADAIPHEGAEDWGHAGKVGGGVKGGKKGREEVEEDDDEDDLVVRRPARRAAAAAAKVSKWKDVSEDEEVEIEDEEDEDEEMEDEEMEDYDEEGSE